MSHNANGQTNTKMERKNILVFFKIIWKKVSHDTSGRTDTMKENLF